MTDKSSLEAAKRPLSPTYF